MPEGPEVRTFCDFLRNLFFGEAPPLLQQQHPSTSLTLNEVYIDFVNNVRHGEYFECHWSVENIFSVGKSVYFVFNDDSGYQRLIESKFGMDGFWGFHSGSHRPDKARLVSPQVELVVRRWFSQSENSDQSTENSAIANEISEDGTENSSEIQNQTGDTNEPIGEEFILSYYSKLNYAHGFREVSNVNRYFDLVGLALGDCEDVDYHQIASEIIQQFSNSNKNIAQVLSSQEVIGGIGNYIRSEAMFLASIYPYTVTRFMSIERLSEVIYCCVFVAYQSYMAGGHTVKDYLQPIIDEDGSFQQASGNYQPYCFKRNIVEIADENNVYQSRIITNKDNPFAKSGSKIYYCTDIQYPE